MGEVFEMTVDWAVSLRQNIQRHRCWYHMAEGTSLCCWCIFLISHGRGNITELLVHLFDIIWQREHHCIAGASFWYHIEGTSLYCWCIFLISHGRGNITVLLVHLFDITWQREHHCIVGASFNLDTTLKFQVGCWLVACLTLNVLYHTTPHWLRWKTCTTYRTSLKQILKWVRVCFLSSVYCKKYRQQIHFWNKIDSFSVQFIQELVLEFKIVTTDTRLTPLTGGPKPPSSICVLVTVG